MLRLLVLGALTTCACGEVHPNNPDGLASDGIRTDGSPSDAPCTPESDSVFCMRLGKNCDPVTGTDNCGMARTANCGSCSGQACLSNVCTIPVCSSFGFGPGSPIAAIDSTVQDALAGVTPSGGTILYQRGAPCGPTYQLYIADETPAGSGQYTSLNLSGLASLSPLRASTEEALNLTADGLGIVGVSSDGTSILMSRRSAIGQMDFGATAGADFAALTVPTPRQISAPVLSSEGLAFYYQISGDPDPNINGIYESVRSSRSVPFPAGTRMPNPVQQYGAATGISSDRLALFVQNTSYQVFVLTRLSLSAPFGNPNAPNPPPMVPGWRTRPLQSCTRLIGTSNGGCANEDTFFFDRL